jgi:hypothetical protein
VKKLLLTNLWINSSTKGPRIAISDWPHITLSYGFMSPVLDPLLWEAFCYFQIQPRLIGVHVAKEPKFLWLH